MSHNPAPLIPAQAMEPPRKRTRQEATSDGHQDGVEEEAINSKKAKVGPTTDDASYHSASIHLNRLRPQLSVGPLLDDEDDETDDDDSESESSDPQGDSDDEDDLQPTMTRPTTHPAAPSTRPQSFQSTRATAVAPPVPAHQRARNIDESDYEDSIYEDSRESATTQNETHNSAHQVYSHPSLASIALGASHPTIPVLSAVSAASSRGTKLSSDNRASSSAQLQQDSTIDPKYAFLPYLNDALHKVQELEATIHDRETTIHAQQTILGSRMETIKTLDKRIHAQEGEIIAQQQELRLIQISSTKEKETHRKYQAAYKDDYARLTEEKEDLKMEKQSMLLDVVKEREVHAQALQKAARIESSQRNALEGFNKKHQELEMLLHDAKSQNAKQANYVNELKTTRTHLESTVNGLDLEVQGLQLLTSTLQGDIVELRQLHEEQNGHNERHRQGLPPAYGSLDQKDRPWWIIHEDAGPVELGTWEREIRSNHAENMRRIYDTCWERRADGDDGMEEMRCIFISGFEAIKAACYALRQLMSKIDDISEVTAFEYRNIPCNGVIGKRSKETRVEKRREPAARVRVGELVAKLLLELPWTLVSAYEAGAYRGTVEFSAAENATVGLAYQEMDEVFLEGLRNAFSAPGDQFALKYAVYSFQHWHTAAEYVNGGLDVFAADINCKAFSKSKEWLEEQIETAKVFAAAARGEGEATVGAAAARVVE